MSDLFKDIIPSILQTKKNVLDNPKDYHAFVVNRALSFHYDCVLQANEMNKVPNTDPDMQYQFLLNTVRGYKRPFRKWEKRETIENLEAVKEFYNCSSEKAKDIMVLLDATQIDKIKKELSKGGINEIGRAHV